MLKPVLFSLFAAFALCICPVPADAQDDATAEYSALDAFPTVYADENVTFRRLDEHTWLGSGKKMYSESLYIVEGDERAVLIDAGTTIPGLKKIVESITSKPYDVILTHAHSDHAGACAEFDEVWVAPADETMFHRVVRRFKGKLKYIEEGQIFDLGGRKLEVLYTPGHTAGSVTFMDVANHYGFSGDAFGNTNLLLGTDFSTLTDTCEKTLDYMCRNKVYFLYNGHYQYDNPETTKRIYDLILISKDIMSGKVKGKPQGLKYIYERDGVKINYGKSQMK